MNRLEEIHAALSTGLAGKISVQGDARYNTARTIWPKSDAVPVFVVHCNNAVDVQHAVRVAREADLALSVRGGGHDWVGRALCDGIVLDLSPMRDIEIASNRGWALVGGGARAVDLFAHTDPRGLCAVTGSVGLVGIAGLTLGGGYGPLLSRFGLASDNLLGAEVVLADGSIVNTTAEGHELIWALRGGGGNFGIVTSLQLQLYDLRSVRSGIIIFPVDEAATIFDGVAAILDTAPDALDVQVGIIPGPQGTFFAAVVPTWSGDPREGETWISSLLKLGTPLVSRVSESSYGASRSVFDQYVINGLRTFMRTRLLPCFVGEVVRVAIEQMRKAPSALCSVLTHDFRGAATRIAPDASAFGLRQKHVMIEILAQAADSEDNGNAERIWVQETAALFDAFALRGGYANLLGPDEQDRIDKSYGENAERLRAAKRRFDPDNLFRSAISLPR